MTSIAVYRSSRELFFNLVLRELRALGLGVKTRRLKLIAFVISAVPVVDPDSKRRRIILPGDVPSPIDPPSGCPFHPRCPVAEDRCKSQVPELREVSPGHWTACHLS